MTTCGDDSIHAKPDYYDQQAGRTIEIPGLTKREYFAARAMQGLLANQEQWKYMLSNRLNVKKEISGLSIEFADALIGALNKTGKL